jgi:hypothetical protein
VPLIKNVSVPSSNVTEPIMCVELVRFNDLLKNLNVC